MAGLKLSENPNWKGGRVVTTHGYRLVKMPAHPDADCRGYMYEHRLVAERKLGRRLQPGEVVHHLNSDRLDNRDENIEVTGSIAEHKMRHRKSHGRQMPGEHNQLALCACGCGEQILRYDAYHRPRRYLSGHNRRGKITYNPMEMIFCACGCRQQTPKYDSYGRERRFINGHNTHVANPNPYSKKGESHANKDQLV